MNPDAIYEIHVDNDGDAVEDITFLFDFDNGLRNEERGLSLQIGEQSVPVPLKNIGPLGPFDNRDVLNVNETYFVGTTLGDRRGQSPVWAERSGSGGRFFTKPYAHVGEKSFPGGYEAYVRSLTNTGELYHDVRFAQCPEGAQEGRVFMGQRKDSFSIALGEIFDLVNFVPLADATPDDPQRDDLADKNVNTLAVEVHKDCLGGGGQRHHRGVDELERAPHPDPRERADLPPPDPLLGGVPAGLAARLAAGQRGGDRAAGQGPVQRERAGR